MWPEILLAIGSCCPWDLEIFELHLFFRCLSFINRLLVSILQAIINRYKVIAQILTQIVESPWTATRITVLRAVELRSNVPGTLDSERLMNIPVAHGTGSIFSHDFGSIAKNIIFKAGQANIVWITFLQVSSQSDLANPVRDASTVLSFIVLLVQAVKYHIFNNTYHSILELLSHAWDKKLLSLARLLQWVLQNLIILHCCTASTHKTSNNDSHMIFQRQDLPFLLNLT